MSALSDYLETKLGDHVLRNLAYTSPASIYWALYLSNPTDADVGAEVSGGAYARILATFGAPTGGVYSNDEIVSATATANWGFITHIGLRDASSGGNLLLHQPLDSSVYVPSGGVFRLPAGSVSVTWK